jgi:hypothetical protein
LQRALELQRNFVHFNLLLTPSRQAAKIFKSNYKKTFDVFAPLRLCVRPRLFYSTNMSMVVEKVKKSAKPI